MTPESARLALRKNMRFQSWIETDLIGGTKRRKARYAAEQDQQRLQIRMRNDEIQRLIDLSDEDLQWLLDNGWSPR